MADVPGKFYRATKVRTGVSPSSPGSIEGEPLPPVNPPGSSLNSVGLTMPSAFTVSNSPLTANGTIGVAGAGTVAQYIRGDGSLADFPESSGGGGSVSYYLNGSVNQGTIGGVAYKELNKVPILGAGTDFSISADGYIASFITDAGDPNLLEIPGGNWNFETYFSSSSSGGTPTFYVELYKYDGTTFTLIASSVTSPEFIAFGTTLTPYFSTLAVPTTTLALTDRLAIRYYVTHSGRTFNLPTASATNRGALSSADWALFTQAYNDKINSAAVTGTTTKTLTLTQQDGGTITASWSDLNTDAVLSVFGRTGAVIAVSGDYTTAQVTESGNLYYTEARVSANTDVAANTAARHNAVTLGTANGLSLSTQQLSLGLASAGVTGALSGTDWSTFNNKANSDGSNASGTWGIAITGNAATASEVAWSNISGQRTLTRNDAGLQGNAGARSGFFETISPVNYYSGASSWQHLIESRHTNDSNNYAMQIAGSFFDQEFYVRKTNNSATTAWSKLWHSGNITPVTSVTASSPLASSGGTTPNITIQQASGSQSGFLSSTDWTTFNSKQNALNGTGFVKISGTTISYDNSIYLTTAAAASTYLALAGGTMNTGAKILGASSGAGVDGGLIEIRERDYVLNAYSAWSYSPAITFHWGNRSIVRVGLRSDGFMAVDDVKFVTENGGTWGIAITGNAGTANTWTNARTITIGNTGKSVDGSANVAWSLSEIGAYAATNPSAFIALTALSGVAPIQYNNSTGEISITQASGSTNGFLSSTDWTTFNNKTSNVGTVTSVAALTLGTSGTDLSSTVANGTTTPVITLNVPNASATNRGALTAADWTTFNNKQNALTNPVTGTGAAGRVSIWNGTTTQTSDADFTYDSTTNILTAGNYYATDGTRQVFLNPGADFGNGANPTVQVLSNHALQFATNNGLRAMITDGGNFLIGTSTPNGNTLRVNGTGWFDSGIFATKGDFGTTYTTTNVLQAIAPSATDASMFQVGMLGVSNGFTIDRVASNIRYTFLDGDVGIGATPTNGARLQVSGVGTFLGRLDVTGTTNYSALKTANTSGNIYWGVDNSTGSDFTGVAYARFIYSEGAYPLITYVNGSERMRINSDGNLGLGVTPSAWTLGKVIEVGTLGNSFWGLGINSVQLSSNYYFDGAYRYANNGFANRYDIGSSGGQHIWFTAPSGTAGQPILSFTQAMTLTASGNLGIGTNSINNKLQIGTTIGYANNAFAIGNGSIDFAIFQESGFTQLYTSGGFLFATDNTEAMRILSSRNVHIGPTFVSDNGARLQVSGDVSVGAASQITLTSGDLRYSSNAGFGIVSANGNRLVSIQNGAFGVTGAATFSSSVNINGATIITADAGNEQLTIRRASNTNEQLIFGFHSSDYAQIQAVEQGVAYRPLALQPNGGNVLIGTTTDNGLNARLQVRDLATITGFATAGLSVRNESGVFAQLGVGVSAGFVGTSSNHQLNFTANSVVLATLKTDGEFQTNAISTSSPVGGTAAIWKLGKAATVSPTSPNRTIEVEVAGTTYYLHAKTTNN